MKILHLCRQYYPSIGGVERFVAELSKRLIARGHTVEVATLNRLWHKRERLASEAMVAGVPVHRLPFSGGALFFIAPGALGLAQRFDVLHIHNTDFFLDFLAATRPFHRRPLIVSTHGGFFHTPAHAALKRLYFSLVTCRSLHAAACVIPDSASDERRFAACARRCVRIDDAIDYAAFSRLERRPLPGRLVTVGRLAPNKNLGALLAAFAHARQTRPDLSLAVVGGGPLLAALQAQARALKIAEAVRWAGEVDEETLRQELAAAEAFVSAATYEGFGLAVLEAMAAGVLPIVNDIDVFRAVIEPGRNGFLADFSQPALAGQALVEVLNLPPERKLALGANAQAKASAYGWEQAIPKFEKVYSEVYGI